MLDRRCKYKCRQVFQFYLFIRDKRNRIYYARYKNGRTITTGHTEIRKAYYYADKMQNQVENNLKTTDLQSILTNYYKKTSKYVAYDIKHGAHYTDKILDFNGHRMDIVAELLSDVESPAQVTRKRLLKLQEQLLARGLSGKTVNNYFSTLHKIFIQLLDKEIITSDPFTDLRPCSFEKEMRMCFPLPKIKGAFNRLDNKYDVLSFIGASTGMRRGEIERIQKDDVIVKDGKKWLKVRGTKSIYSVREVPLSDETEKAINSFLLEDIQQRDWKRAVLNTGQKIGLGQKYIEDNGIVFHSFRKLYKTLLTQANLNTSLIETLMGHSTQNQKSNDVERIYFVAESADLRGVHDKVVEVLKYLTG